MSYNSFSNSDLEYEKRRLQEMPIEESEEVVATDLPETPREEVMHKGSKSSDYESLFLTGAGIPTRNGKLLSIREKYHRRIAKLVQSLGRKDVSIFSYVDNILSYHFDTYREEIKAIYSKGVEDDEYLTS